MKTWFFCGFLFILFLLWKILNFFQLPNTFAVILSGTTFLMGIVWIYYHFSVLPRRNRQITRIENRQGVVLTAEEREMIMPFSPSLKEFGSYFGIMLAILFIRSFLYEPFQIPSSSMEPTLRIGDFILVEKFSYGIKDPIFQTTIIETNKPKRGDVVVFKSPPEPNLDYIKRVIGLPGDLIKYNPKTNVLTVKRSCTDKEKPCIEEPCKYTDVFLSDEFVDQWGTPQTQATEFGAVKHQILISSNTFETGANYYQQDDQAPNTWLVPAGHYFVMGDNRNNSRDSRYWGFVPEQYLVGKAIVVWLSLDKQQDQWPTGFRYNRFFTTIE